MKDKPQLLIAVDEKIINQLISALNRSNEVIEKMAKRVEELELKRERDRLMTESEAMAYLKRDAGTLHYYRTNGLKYYKHGRYVWYTKGEIDDWLAAGKVNRRAY